MSVQVNLWGLDAIKTKGESVGIVLHLLGARPLSEGAHMYTKSKCKHFGSHAEAPSTCAEDLPTLWCHDCEQMAYAWPCEGRG